MSKKEGIVVSIDGKYVNLLTSCGEFVKVDCNGKKLDIGEKFVGSEVKSRYLIFNTRKILAAACIVLALITCGAFKAYYSPSATVIVDINPNIELKVNFLNRIISSKALNNDGKEILNQIKINNANVNDGLKKIIDQSKKDKFINSNYVKTKIVSINISGKSIDISKFKSDMKASNLSIKIQSNGNVVFEKNLSKKLKNPNKNSNSSNLKQGVKQEVKQGVKDAENVGHKINNGYSSRKNTYKLPSDVNSQRKSSTYNNRNSTQGGYSGRVRSVQKQMQNSISNRSSGSRINKEPNSIKNIQNYNNARNKINGHKNSSNKNNMHSPNPNAAKNKIKH